MQSQRRSVRLLLLASLAASAGTEQTLPTAIPDGPNAAVVQAAGPNAQKLKVKTMQLSSYTPRINGPSVSGQVSIGNSGLAGMCSLARREVPVLRPARPVPRRATPSRPFASAHTAISC